MKAKRPLFVARLFLLGAVLVAVGGCGSSTSGGSSGGNNDGSTPSGVTPPVITTPPQSRTVAVGQTAAFSVAVTGSAPLVYQWRKGGTDIPGASSSLYTTAAVTSADHGAQFTVVVSNSAGTATSSAATLSVNEVPPVRNGSRYLSGSILSPTTPTVAARLKTLFELGQTKGLKADVLFKVGDSITVGETFLEQFKHPVYIPGSTRDWDYAHNLGSYQSLEGARAHFLNGRIGSENPYERTSLAARVGMDAAWALAVPAGGSTFPLAAEWQASQGAYAVIMFGTNDFYPRGESDASVYRFLVKSTTQMLDYCIANGSVPILTAPPPYPEPAQATMRARMTSRLYRAVAQGRQVPFVDYYASMLDLPGHGLQQGDIHPNAMAYNRSAFLTTEGLQYGYNMRNLITLQSLDRMYRLLAREEVPPDAETGGLRGAGLVGDLFLIDGPDFSDFQAPVNGTTAVFYRLTVADNQAWQFVAAGLAGDAINIEIRNDQGALVGASTEGTLAQTLTAGTYSIKAGFPASVHEFVFVALEESSR